MLVIKQKKSLNKLIKVFDLPTKQIILQQLLLFFCLNCSKKEMTVQLLAQVQPLVHLPYFEIFNLFLFQKRKNFWFMKHFNFYLLIFGLILKKFLHEWKNKAMFDFWWCKIKIKFFFSKRNIFLIVDYNELD